MSFRLTLIQSPRNQVCGKAFQYVILHGLATAPPVAMQVRTRYAGELARA